MPGTIQVSILELVGLSTLPQSSSMGVKVSMGKQAHEMQDKGDHSFALASLRDNLSVSVHDSEGNELGHTGVETRLIIEKGTWEDSFSLDGGGHVRMRLHFILTEEEQNRIRSMRESATRRKHEDVIKRSHSSSDLAVAPGGRLNSSSASRGDSLKTKRLIQQDNVSCADGPSMMISAGSRDQAPRKVPPGQKKQVFSSSKSTGALDKLPGYQRLKEVMQQREGAQQRQIKKTPSSVRNMILAFETSPAKDALPAGSKARGTSRLSSITATDISMNAPKKTVAVSGKLFLSDLETVPAPNVEKKIKEREDMKYYMAACPETSISSNAPKKTVTVNAKPVPSDLRNVSVPSPEKMLIEREDKGDYRASRQETLSPTTEQFKELKVPSIDQMSNEKYVAKIQPAKGQNKEQFSLPEQKQLEPLSEERKFSWKAFFGALPRRQDVATDSLTEKLVSTSYESLVLKETWRSKHWKSSRLKMRPKVTSQNEYYISASHHGWIFLEEMISSCVPSDDRSFIDVSEGGLSDCSRATISEKVRDTDVVPSNDEKNSDELKDFESRERSDSSAPIRPVRQVMNIAIMVGFGLLVLLTRQRK